MPGLYTVPFVFRFNHSDVWKVTKESKNPLTLEMMPDYGDVVLSIRETQRVTDLAKQQQLVLDLASSGMVTSGGLTFDKLKGFQVIWNRQENGKSRHHTTRSFVYKESYFEIETNFDRPSDYVTKAEADIAAMLKTWLWL